MIELQATLPSADLLEYHKSAEHTEQLEAIQYGLDHDNMWVLLIDWLVN